MNDKTPEEKKGIAEYCDYLKKLDMNDKEKIEAIVKLCKMRNVALLDLPPTDAEIITEIKKILEP